MKISNFFFFILLVISVYTLSACHRKTVPSGSNTSKNTNNPNNGDKGNSEIDIAGMADNILFYVNKHRKAIGKPDLQMLNAASVEAAKHSNNMAAKRVAFGHTGFEGRISAISKSLGGTVSAAAENVADGKLTAQQVVDGWLHSPGHKKNIEGNYTLTGIGLAKDAGGVIFFTQIFVHK